MSNTHSRQCLTTFPNTLKFIKNTVLCIVFSTHFSVFGNVFKHSLSGLIYYFQSVMSIVNYGHLCRRYHLVFEFKLENHKSLNQALSLDVSGLERWARENKMYMNMQKTKALFVTGQRLWKRII